MSTKILRSYQVRDCLLRNNPPFKNQHISEESHLLNRVASFNRNARLEVAVDSICLCAHNFSFDFFVAGGPTLTVDLSKKLQKNT